MVLMILDVEVTNVPAIDSHNTDRSHIEGFTEATLLIRLLPFPQLFTYGRMPSWAMRIIDSKSDSTAGRRLYDISD